MRKGKNQRQDLGNRYVRISQLLLLITVVLLVIAAFNYGNGSVYQDKKEGVEDSNLPLIFLASFVFLLYILTAIQGWKLKETELRESILIITGAIHGFFVFLRKLPHMVIFWVTARRQS